MYADFNVDRILLFKFCVVAKAFIALSKHLFIDNLLFILFGF